MEYTISILKDESRIDELIELFRTGLGETTKEHWKWRLFTPNGMPQPEAMVVDDENGKMVAMTSALFEYYGNYSKKVVQFGDWVVHPDYRGQGLIGRLYRYALEKYAADGCDFSIEFPNENSLPILLKYGYEIKEPVQCWETSPRLLYRKKLTDFCQNGVSFCFSSVCPITEFKQREDRITRTTEFMRWKFDGNPNAQFFWLSVKRNGEILGYFVYALTKGRIRTVVTVYDWEFDVRDSEAFCSAVIALRRLGNSVNIWGRYGEDERELLQKSGFRMNGNGARLVLNAISQKGYPQELTLTRIDTDY